MPRKKKPFIDKKNAVTFHLVHRSQKDPLQADDKAPQRVLLPAGGQKTKDEERKYGVFFDDEYNYMQHLRDVQELYEVEPIESFRVTRPPQLIPQDLKPSIKQTPSVHQKPNINLPSDVFASNTETSVGLLNKAAPVSGPLIDWDPDIVAALDEDFDYGNPDNLLEDDFMALANAEGGQGMEIGSDEGELFEDDDDADIYRPVRGKISHDNDVASDEAEYSDDECGSDVGSLGERFFDDVETKSRFTDYSMTSSVATRNEGLTFLDDRFEKFYEQYDEEGIGALDQEDIAGCRSVENDMLKQAMAEFEDQQKEPTLQEVMIKGNEVVQLMSEDDDEDDDDDLVKMVIKPDKPKWDCESILSTHSTLYNHPVLIEEPKKDNTIKLTKRAGIPADALPTRGLTRKQLEEEYKQDICDHANTYRPKIESTEERKLRKQAIKEERRNRREQKKSNQLAFKSEKIRQEKEQLNLRHNIQGLTLA